MRAAPAVSVQCTGGPAWRWFVGLLAGAALACLLAMLLGHQQRPLVPALAALPLTAALIARRRKPPPVLLVWNGQCWTADGQPCSVTLRLDLGGWLLLGLRAEPATASTPWRAWLARHVARARLSRVQPVSCSDAGPAWHALRVALVGQGGERRPSDPLPAGPAHG